MPSTCETSVCSVAEIRAERSTPPWPNPVVRGQDAPAIKDLFTVKIDSGCHNAADAGQITSCHGGGRRQQPSFSGLSGLQIRDRELRCDVTDRGIPAAAQKMILTAASRAGMSVGEWLNEVILDAAAEEGVQELRDVFQDRMERRRSGNLGFATICSRIDDLTAKVRSLSQSKSALDVSAGTGASRSGIDPEQQQAIFDQLSDLLKMPTPADSARHW
jgi:hypothetical protein